MIAPHWWWFGAIFPAAIAALTLWIGHTASRGRNTAVSWSVAIGTGFLVGYPATAGVPRFPPIEAQQWLVLVVIPAALLIELIGAWHKIPRRVTSVFRLIVVVALPAVLLQSYLQYTWSASSAAGWLGGLAVFLGISWWIQRRLAARRPGRWTAWAWLIVVGGTAVTILLSGSNVLGQVAITFTAVIAGSAVVAWFITPSQSPVTVLPFVPLIAVSGLWLIGHFYASLTWQNALLLGSAPLLPWVAEIPVLGRLSPTWRAAVRLFAAAIPVSIAVMIAAAQFSNEVAPY